MDDEYVLITASQYRSLLDAEDELTALDCAGVDNWSGYGEVDWEEIESSTNNQVTIASMPKFNIEGKKL